MQPMKLSSLASSGLLMTQLKKIADSIGVKAYHCPQCGKIEFYR